MIHIGEAAEAAAGAVTAYRDGELLRIEVPPDASEEEFRRVLTVMGVNGSVDYDVEYDPETGTETWVMPYPATNVIPFPRRLNVQPPVSMVAGLIGTGIPGVMTYFMALFG